MLGCIDWGLLWKQQMENSSARRLHRDMIAFWDKRAESLKELMNHNTRAERYIAKMDIRPGSTILDVGAGPGTLAIPLARMAKKVTAIEPSREMLKLLQEEVEKEGLKNLTWINKRWEDVGRGEVDHHDVVIASHSLGMLDIKDALLKMNDLSKEYVYLFVRAGTGMDLYRGLWSKLFGEEFIPGPDYIYLYNMLYEMGIYANVDIFEEEYVRTFSSLEQAVEHWVEVYEISDTQTKKIIESYLAEKLTNNGHGLESRYKLKTALVWWGK